MSRKLALDVIEVAEPCREDWDAMRGDERVRFCGLCHRDVYNLAGMSRDEAERLVTESEDRVCVRFVRRADGTVTTSDCAPDRLAAMRRGARRSLTLAGAAVAGVFALVGAVGAAAFTTGAVGDVIDKVLGPPDIEMMGEMVEPEDLAPPPDDTEVDEQETETTPEAADAPTDA